MVLRFLIVLLLASLFAATSSFAEGRMLIKPYVETGWQRDTNFHKSEKNTKTVDTYNVKPGIKLGYTTDKSTVSLDYWFKVLRYTDQDENQVGQINADTFDYTAHNADFTAQSQVSDRLLIGLDDQFMKTRDPANADERSNAVDRYKYTMNRVSPRLTYNFAEKFGLGLKYANLYTDYSDDGPGQGEDSMQNRGTFTLFYYFTSKTAFDLDYQVWTRDYDKASVDYTSNQFMVNLKHQFNYLTLTAGAGYHDRTFDKTVPSGDIEKFIWKFSVLGQNPPDATGIPKSSMYFAVGSNLNDAGNGDSYFTSLRFDAKFTYLLMDKINWTLAGSFQNSDYETSSRNDDRYQVSLGADYLINDFFSLGLSGGLEDRDSNEAGKDFDNKYVMLNAKFNYDLGSK